MTYISGSYISGSLASLLLLASASAFAQTTPIPALVTKAIAHAAGDLAQNYSYHRKTMIQATGAPREETVDSYDPTRPLLNRWKNISRSGGEKGKGASFNTGPINLGGPNEKNIIGYVELKEITKDSKITLIDETPERAHYSIRTKPGRKIKLGGASFESDVFEKGMIGDLYVRKTGFSAPYVYGLKFGIPEIIEAVVIKIIKLNVGYGFVPDPKTGDMVAKSFGLQFQAKFPIMPKINASVLMVNSDFSKVVSK
jgi:hypothetical protein